MKTTTLMVALLILGTTTSYANNKCEGLKCNSTKATAAGTMIAGAAAMRSFIKASDIEKRFLRTIFSVSSKNPVIGTSSTLKIKPGDKVIVTFSNDNHLNVTNQKRSQLLSAIQDMSSQIEERQAELKRWQLEPRTDFAKNLIQIKHDEIQGLQNVRANLLQEVNQLNTKLKVVVKPTTKVFSNTTANFIDYEVESMMKTGKSVYKIQRVPVSIVRKVSTVTKGGYVLAGTAVALGLLTAEEIYSGKVATRLDNEYKKMK